MMPSAHRLAGLLLLALLPACGGSGGGSDGGADGRTDDPCQAGQTRCDYLAYQECIDGFFAQTRLCQPPQVCAQDLGCVACNPTWPTTCVGDDVFACRPDASLGELVEHCLTGCSYGACEGGCSAASQLIYTVDDSYRLLSFSPAGGANEFRLIRQLDCPAGGSWPSWGNPTATPFSMSVDRTARAWVLYTSGEIFYVDTTSGACTASGWTPGQGGLELFGMGFVTDVAGSDTEKLYIAGGAADDLQGGQLARIDPADMSLSPIGPVPQAEYSPELTGTGDARWYAYFPGQQSSFVAELDRAFGQIVRQWPLPPLGGTVRAWAFAHWGGRFYVFVTVCEGGGSNSQVLRLDPVSGQTETVLEQLPYVIVGAGVSTCAPTFEP